MGNLNLYYFELQDNQLSGIIPEEICNAGAVPAVSNNNLCPPYPDCISKANIDSHDTSGCLDVSLSLTATETSATISYTSSSDITEFMFTVSGVTMTSTSSGLEINQYSNQTGAVLGNSPNTNAVLPAGSGTLVAITFEPLTSAGQISINGISVSSSSGLLAVDQSSLESVLSYTDQCGVLNGDNSTCTDCAGVINGTAVEDECGVCNGDGSTSDWCYDEDGDGFGDPSTYQNNVCYPGEGWVLAGLCTDTEPDCFANDTDCLGVCGGDYLYDDPNDSCGNCSVEVFGNCYDIETTTTVSLSNSGHTGPVPPEI